MSRISVTFANTFAQQASVQVPIESGTTVGDFLATQGGIPDNAQFRVNRQTVGANTVLNLNDIVSLVPTQIKGA